MGTFSSLLFRWNVSRKQSSARCWDKNLKCGNKNNFILLMFSSAFSGACAIFILDSVVCVCVFFYRSTAEAIFRGWMSQMKFSPHVWNNLHENEATTLIVRRNPGKLLSDNELRNRKLVRKFVNKARKWPLSLAGVTVSATEIKTCLFCLCSWCPNWPNIEYCIRILNDTRKTSRNIWSKSEEFFMSWNEPATFSARTHISLHVYRWYCGGMHTDPF